MLARMALLLMLSPATVGAQQVIDLSSFERCRTCEVEQVLDLLLGDPDLPGGIESEWAQVVFDDVHGGYAVFHISGTHVQLFDSLGTFQRVLSREGGGPGELRWLNGVGFAGGNIVMVDARGQKYVVMSPHGKLIADTRLDVLSGTFRVLVTSADTMVVGWVDRWSDVVSHPLHLVSLSDGEVLRDFGYLEAEWNREEPRAELIFLGHAAGDRSLWRGYSNRLRLEEWGLDGSLIRVVTGDFDWFPPTVYRQESPPSSLINFTTDNEDRLWLLTRVADPDWRRVRMVGPESLLRREDHDRFWDTRLDVFDLRTEEHLGTVRWDDARVRLTNREETVLLHLLEYDEQMVPRVALYRLDIKASP